MQSWPTQHQALEAVERGGDRRLRVLVTVDNLHEGFELLAPGGRTQWGRCDFLLNPPTDTRGDFWIVAANARPVDRMRCAPENTLFIAGEPLEKKLYPQGFYRQFHWVVDSHEQSRHPRLTVDALGLNWHVGLQQPGGRYVYGYDRLSRIQAPAKENKISVVCSNLRTTEGQRRRLEFLDEAKRCLGENIVHCGRGFTPIADKLDALLPYRFHLTLENCEQPNYWTEKIADAFLGWALPIYVGCPNIHEFFSPESVVRIDPSSAEQSIETMRRLLASPVTPREQAAIAESRDTVLNRWNPFAVWARWAEARWQPAEPTTVVIRSHKAFRSLLRGPIYRLRTLAGRGA